MKPATSRAIVAMENRWAEGEYDRRPALAGDLVYRDVGVIVAGGGPPTALATKAATATISFVFISGSDPIKDGLVSSFNRPGGNATGVYLFVKRWRQKKLELLSALVPQNALIILVNPKNPSVNVKSNELQIASQVLGRQIRIFNASTEGDIDTAFETLTQQGAGALLVGADPFFSARRAQFVNLAARHALPTIGEWREFVAAGGLMSYGTSISDAYRQMGRYTGRILKGEKPADLPTVAYF